MTMGNYLRGRRGYAPELVEEYDDYARLGLAQAGWATCQLVEVPEEIPLLLFVSDGVSDHVDQGTWKRLCHLHEAGPQALADALGGAPTALPKPHRRNVTKADGSTTRALGPDGTNL